MRCLFSDNLRQFEKIRGNLRQWKVGTSRAFPFFPDNLRQFETIQDNFCLTSPLSDREFSRKCNKRRPTLRGGMYPVTFVADGSSICCEDPHYPPLLIAKRQKTKNLNHKTKKRPHASWPKCEDRKNPSEPRAPKIIRIAIGATRFPIRKSDCRMR